ncbi:MAG: peptidoglycan D,D-transpeptidase FtsI family protein [Bacilli bacterium]
MLNKLGKFLVIILFAIIIGRVSYLYFFKHDEYYREYLNYTNKIVYGLSKARGRILDVNGNVIVDNKEVYNIVYRHLKGNYVENAYEIAKYIKIDNDLSEDELKDFYLLNQDFFYLITDEEQDLYAERKLSYNELRDLKRKRITNETEIYDEDDLNAIAIYYKIVNGYSYDNKIVKAKDVTKNECALVSEAKIPGLTCEIAYERSYNYENITSIMGEIGSIPKEEASEYKNKGYDLNDKVGLSYLEKEYESYLKGTKDEYIVNEDNTLTKISNGRNGYDLYLSIDVNLQQRINEAMKEVMRKAKTMKNTSLYNRSYIIVSDPNDGSIITATGLSYYDDEFYDVTSDIIFSSFTVGSVVKGATISVGYQNNLIEVGKKINDSCIKLNLVPEKCSYKRWGMIDDVTALRTSSNYYQFLLAIKLTGLEYKRNMILPVSEREFDIYRNTLASFGLGSKTGIDLPGETTGIKGNIIAPDLLLNLSIGQYDTYTPLQLSQYINTIAMDGVRNQLSLMNKIVDNKGNIIKQKENVVLSRTESRFDRIKEGMRQVLDGGTGRGYVKTKYKPAGKTGTSEVYYDANSMTINQSFVMFAPLDNPKYSITIVSPNVSVSKVNEENDYTAPINYMLSREITEIVYNK